MSRRDQIALTADERRSYVAAARTVILTTLDPHGYPHPVPMWFVVDPDETVWMSTGGGGGNVGWINTKMLDETGDIEKSQGWTALVLDTNGGFVEAQGRLLRKEHYACYVGGSDSLREAFKDWVEPGEVRWKDDDSGASSSAFLAFSETWRESRA